MEYKNEHQRQMAILEAAMPYMAPNGRYAVKLLLQADSFVSLARHGEENDLEAAEAGAASMPFQPNPQEMLQNIQRFLTPREADTVQTLLNFINARKLFQNYTKFVHEQNESGEDNSPDLASASFSNLQNPFRYYSSLSTGLAHWDAG